MRFFVDENLSPTLAAICRGAGYDATSVRDRGMLNATDREVSMLCSEEVMINSVLEVEENGDCQLFEHP